MVDRISSIKTICLLLGLAVAAAFAPAPAVAASIVGSKHDFSSSGVSTDLSDPRPFAGTFEVLGPGGFYETIDQVCVFCHTPHHSDANTVGAPLWNRSTNWAVNSGNYSYSMYASATLSVTISAGPTGISALCMSCHDGVTSIAVSTLLNPPGSASPGDVRWTSTGPLGDTRGAIGNAIYEDELTGKGWRANLGGLIPDYDPGPGAVINLSNDHPVSFDYPASVAGIKPNKPDDGRLRLFSGRVECATCHLVHDPAIPPFLAMPNDGSGMCLSCHDI